MQAPAAQNFASNIFSYGRAGWLLLSVGYLNVCNSFRKWNATELGGARGMYEWQWGGLEQLSKCSQVT